MESKGWCFPYYGSILWTHNNENDSKNVFIGRNTISLLDRPRKDVIEEGNKPFIFLCVLFSSHHQSWVKRKNWSHKTAGIGDDYLGITYYTKKRVWGGGPRKKWFSKGEKSSIFMFSKGQVVYHLFLNFTDRRCLCVGNAGRSEVPNRNSICIPSVSKINVDKILCALQKTV